MIGLGPFFAVAKVQQAIPEQHTLVNLRLPAAGASTILAPD
jgi:hypothetical protein